MMVEAILLNQTKFVVIVVNVITTSNIDATIYWQYTRLLFYIYIYFSIRHMIELVFFLC